MEQFVYNPADYMKQTGSYYGSPTNVNKNYFNQNRGYNWKDSTAYAYQQIAKHEDNAFSVGLLNYMNEYNSPLEQMKRYQAAGLNPVDALGKTNTSAQIQSASGGSAQAHKTQEMAQYINLGNSIVDGVSQILEKSLSAKESLIKLHYLDMNEYNKANTLRYSPLIAESNFYKALSESSLFAGKADAQSLSNLVVGLSLLEKLWSDGISTNLDGSTLSGVLNAYGIKDTKIKDDSYFAKMSNALLELRKQNKDTQEAQEESLKANKDKTLSDLDLRHLTGIDILDKILNYIFQ